MGGTCTGVPASMAMPRFYFDIRDNEALAPDEEGLELPDMRAAEVEAAHSLAHMAKDMPSGTEHHHMAVEVRTDDGPIFKATFVFKLTRH
jgi:hypothetical protein